MAEELAVGQSPRKFPLAGALTWLTHRHTWIPVFATLVGMYLATNLGLPKVGFFSGFVRVYVAQPIMWTGVIAGVVMAARYATTGGLTFNRSMLGIGLLLGGFQIAVMVISGLLSSLGRSPYTLDPVGILTNFVFWGTTLVGTELIRAYLLSVFARRYTTTALGIIAVLFTALEPPLVRFTNLPGPLESIPFFGGGALLPLFGENLMASFLAMVGRPVPAIAYRGMLEAFEWLSPILPDPAWVIKGFIGIMVPVVGMVVVQSLYLTEAEPKDVELKEPEPETQVEPKSSSRAKRVYSLVSWAAVGIISLALVSFSVGAFGVRPGVVLTGSTSPSISAGDIALTKEIAIDTINEGDIVQYYDPGKGITIWHRVIEIQEKGGSRAFIMKGDANNTPDLRPILPEQIRGRVVFVVPKLGLVSIEIKKLLADLL